jgi:hypothetical protein
VRSRSFLMAAAIAVGAALSAPSTAVAQTGREIVCESLSGKFDYCTAATRGTVRLVRQMSDTKCVLDRTWGFDERGVWVDRGCRGRFALGGNGGGGWQSGDNGRQLRCESQGNQYEFCRISTRGDVRLRRQLSKDPCVAGRTWGFQRDGVWVADGCRAEFEVGYYNASWENGQRLVTCESEDNDYRRCRTWTYGEVRVARNLSQRRCRQGTNWGYDNNGIWVDDGCRAVFAVGSEQNGGGWGQYPGGGGTGGNGSSWEQAKLQAAASCTDLTKQRGFRNVLAQGTERRYNGDVAVRLDATLGSSRYKVSCLYHVDRRRAEILGQDRY